MIVEFYCHLIQRKRTKDCIFWVKERLDAFDREVETDLLQECNILVCVELRVELLLIAADTHAPHSLAIEINILQSISSALAASRRIDGRHGRSPLTLLELIFVHYAPDCLIVAD